MTTQEQTRIRETLAALSDELWEIVAKNREHKDDTTMRLIVLAEDVGECHANIQRVEARVA